MIKKVSSLVLPSLVAFSGLIAQRVGINITAPTEALHVDSVIKIGKSQAIGTSTPNRKNQLRFGDGDYVTIGEELADDKMYIRYGDLVFIKSPGSGGSGYVGFGTDAPTASLDIAGSIRIRANAAAGRVLTSDASGNAGWLAPAAGGGLTLPYSGTHNASGSAFVITNDYAGFGTTMVLRNTSAANSGPVIDVYTASTSGFATAIAAEVVSTSSNDNAGVYGEVSGTLAKGIGVHGKATAAVGVRGQSETGTGVWGSATSGYATYGRSTQAGGIGGYFLGTGGAVPLVAFNQQSTTDIAIFMSGGAVNRARIDATGKGFFNGGTQTGGADVAEAFAVEGLRNSYEPGDVLVISKSTDRTVEKSSKAYSTLVVGVYATKPGVLLTERMENESLSDLVPMGVVGVIPVKVTLEGGAIERGDLLVTSSTTGHAMKGDPQKITPGTVLGKALQNFNAGKNGIINVLVNVK